MNERMEDLQEFVRQLGDCIPPKSSSQRKNYVDKITKAKEVTDDIRELVNSSTEEDIRKCIVMDPSFLPCMFSHEYRLT